MRDAPDPVHEAVSALRAAGLSVEQTGGVERFWRVEGQKYPLTDNGVVTLAAHLALLDAARGTR